jgi:lactoylglutathione lyase
MRDDPRINFAISTRAQRPGVDPVDIQTEAAEEPAALQAAAIPCVAPLETRCCHARSDND